MSGGHLNIHAQCLVCGLHFVVLTWEPERHARTTLYCPECGQRKGEFELWREQTDEGIVEVISGDEGAPEPPVVHRQ
jgi:hypothetical protein